MEKDLLGIADLSPDEIYLILSLMDDPNKYPIAGKVAWITPVGANNNKAHNLAIKRAHVDGRLRFVNATLYRVNSITSESVYSVDQLDFATALPDGRLDWNGRRSSGH